MKNAQLILASLLVLGSANALAMKNSDPAAGGNQPAAKVAPPTQTASSKADPVMATPPKPLAAPKAAAAAKVVAPKAAAVVAAPAPAPKVTAKKSKAKAEPQAAAEAKPAPGSLEDQLKQLDTGNQIPAGANREKMYAVQQRYLPLRWKNEITLGGGSNLTGDNFIRTQQLEAGYRLHINDRWSVALQHAWVDNKLKSEVEGIKTNNGALPDVPYSISRTDLTGEFNVFYGKFRWTAETVSYFDQYLALGAAQIEQNTGTSTGYVADAGFAFWVGKFGSTRIGLKDYYYQENYRSGAQWTHNIHAHLDLGYLF